MSNTPTDAEIDEVTLDVLGYAALDKETNDTARMIARAIERAPRHHAEGWQLMSRRARARRDKRAPIPDFDDPQPRH